MEIGYAGPIGDIGYWRVWGHEGLTMKNHTWLLRALVKQMPQDPRLKPCNRPLKFLGPPKDPERPFCRPATPELPSGSKALRPP